MLWSNWHLFWDFFAVCWTVSSLNRKRLKHVKILGKVKQLENKTCIFFPPKKAIPGLPWWHSGWESACRCGGRGFGPWSGGIPRAAERLGPWAAIAGPARLEPVLRSRRGRGGGRPAHRDEEWPPLAAAGGSPRTETRTQHSHKIKN